MERHRVECFRWIRAHRVTPVMCGDSFSGKSRYRLRGADGRLHNERFARNWRSFRRVFLIVDADFVRITFNAVQDGIITI